jgi:hypothetical protein
METASLTLHGDGADRVSEKLVEETATVGARSINRLGVDDVHRYRGGGVTLLAYERASAYREAWVMVNVLFETVDDETCRVAVLVGGGREGPFRIKDLEQRLDRWLVGEEEYGETGRLGSVVESIEAVCDELDVRMELH